MRYKTIVLAVVLLLVAGVLAKPHIPFLNRGGQEFNVTPEPLKLYEEAIALRRPIFLEFYASW